LLRGPGEAVFERLGCRSGLAAAAARFDAAGAAPHPRDQFVAAGTIRHAQALRLHRPEKKKAPEGAFNMLRLVRQAD